MHKNSTGRSGANTIIVLNFCIFSAVLQTWAADLKETFKL